MTPFAGTKTRLKTFTNGSVKFAIKDQNGLLDQAIAYSKNFPGGAIYRTNSPEFAAYYSEIFKQAGIKNVTFKITPVVGK